MPIDRINFIITASFEARLKIKNIFKSPNKSLAVYKTHGNRHEIYHCRE